MSRQSRSRKQRLERVVGPTATRATSIWYECARGVGHASVGAVQSRVGRYSREAGRLRALHDRYAGERCVIIGNGPSLRKMDLASIASERTFGLNRIYLKFNELGFATTFLVCINGLVWEQFGHDIGRQSSILVAPWRERERLRSRSDAYFVRTDHRPVFRRNIPREGVWEGGTVTFVAMQLAYYLGFRQVVLIGVDHAFTAVGVPNSTVESKGADADHFDPSYFGPGVRWQLPDLDSSERAFRSAREAFAKDGREIVDATVGGQLDVFRKVEFEALFGRTGRADGRPPQQ